MKFYPILSRRYLLIIVLTIILLLSLGILFYKSTNTDKNKSYEQVQHTEFLDENKETTNKSQQNNLGFIEALRERDFSGGNIVTEETLSNNGIFTSYIISYTSDNLKIYGLMNVPNGEGPFPVIVLNHGYYNTASFTSGDGTQSMANILAKEGYITLASDYRGHGKSENDSGRSGGHRPEYSIDVLNLMAAIPSLEKANEEKIGMWGHSLGGEVSLRAGEATEAIDAIVLWAPTSGRVSDNKNFYGGTKSLKSETDNVVSNGASPINYLKYISAPISLHQGLSDTEVDPEWSKELNKALIDEQKEVEYFEYKGQDHNFRNLGWDEISKNTLDFYEKYLK